MKTAFVFPGQSSQVVGMGRAFYESFEIARSLIEEAEYALALPLRRLMFEGPIEDLTQTDIAQPALFTVSMAILKSISSEKEVLFFAGHSLGEYTALCAAGALSFKDCLDLVRFRGLSMKNANQDGAMAAILGLEIEAIEKFLQGDCVIANDNAPGQIIISGSKASVEKTCAIIQGAKRIMLLPVSGPFHSPLMLPAQKEMLKKLDCISFNALQKPVISNVTAKPFENNIKDLLLKQIVEKVRWRETIQYLSEQGVERIFEIGSQSVLTGLNRRIAPHLECKAIYHPDCFE